MDKKEPLPQAERSAICPPERSDSAERLSPKERDLQTMNQMSIRRFAGLLCVVCAFGFLLVGSRLLDSMSSGATVARYGFRGPYNETVIRETNAERFDDIIESMILQLSVFGGVGVVSCLLFLKFRG